MASAAVFGLCLTSPGPSGLFHVNSEPIDTILIEPDDVTRLDCSSDRSHRDPTLEPAHIVWSDGTDDEMCFASIVTRPI